MKTCSPPGLQKAIKIGKLILNEFKLMILDKYLSVGICSHPDLQLFCKRMSVARNKTIKQLTLGAMIIIMAAMLVNKAVYIHVHVLPDGTLITHAHPFNKTPDSSQSQKHQHSSLEFFLLQELELLMLTTIMVLVLVKVSRNLAKRWFVLKPVTAGLCLLQPGRAPPPCM